jgi:hypothetical protein
MVELEKPGFDAGAFLASADLGRRIILLAPKDAFFSQGDSADSVFYFQNNGCTQGSVALISMHACIRAITSTTALFEPFHESCRRSIRTVKS